MTGVTIAQIGDDTAVVVASSGDNVTIVQGVEAAGPPGVGGGVTDHGALTGLADDDHTQYHNDARGDARYTQKANNLSDVASTSTALSNLGGVPTSRTVSAGTGLTGGGDLSADRTLAVSYGTTAGTAAQGNDSRLSDTRTPTDGTVTDAKVSASAAIALSKLASIADQRLLGNVSGGSAAATALTAAQVKTLLAIATGDVSGLGTVATLASDTDGTLAANSDTRVATQKATKTYADGKVPKSTVTTKGDLIAATGSGAVTNLAVGSNDSVPLADSAQTAGIRWGQSAATVLPFAPLGGHWHFRSGFSSQAMTQNRIHLLGFAVMVTHTISGMTVHCSATAASSTIKLGLYSANTDGTPNALIDSASVATDASTGMKTGTFSSNQQLVAGKRYYLAVMAAGGAPSAYGSSDTNSLGQYEFIQHGNNVDNLTRRPHYFKAAAVAGTLDASISGASFDYSSGVVPNLGVVVASVP